MNRNIFENETRKRNKKNEEDDSSNNSTQQTNILNKKNEINHNEEEKILTENTNKTTQLEQSFEDAIEINGVGKTIHNEQLDDGIYGKGETIKNEFPEKKEEDKKEDDKKEEDKKEDDKKEEDKKEDDKKEEDKKNISGASEIIDFYYNQKGEIIDTYGTREFITFVSPEDKEKYDNLKQSIKDKIKETRKSFITKDEKENRFSELNGLVAEMHSYHLTKKVMGFSVTRYDDNGNPLPPEKIENASLVCLDASGLTHNNAIRFALKSGMFLELHIDDKGNFSNNPPPTIIGKDDGDYPKIIKPSDYDEEKNKEAREKGEIVQYSYDPPALNNDKKILNDVINELNGYRQFRFNGVDIKSQLIATVRGHDAPDINKIIGTEEIKSESAESGLTFNQKEVLKAKSNYYKNIKNKLENKKENHIYDLGTKKFFNSQQPGFFKPTYNDIEDLTLKKNDDNYNLEYDYKQKKIMEEKEKKEQQEKEQKEKEEKEKKEQQEKEQKEKEEKSSKNTNEKGQSNDKNPIDPKNLPNKNNGKNKSLNI